MNNFDFDEVEKVLVDDRRLARENGESDALSGRAYNPDQLPKTPGGGVLKWYLEAYDQGYRHPGEYKKRMKMFEDIESTLKEMPTSKLEHTSG